MNVALRIALSSHRELKKSLNEISILLASLNFNPQTSQEKFDLLKQIIVIVHKISETYEKFKKHIEFIESIVYPELEKANYKREVHELNEAHKNVGELTDEIKDEVTKYRNPEIMIEDIARTINVKFLKLKDKIMYHVKLEEELFKKMIFS